MVGVCHNIYQLEIFMKLNLQKNERILIKSILRTQDNNCGYLLERDLVYQSNTKQNFFHFFQIKK